MAIQKNKLLIISDNKALRENLCLQLELFGYLVQAENVAEFKVENSLRADVQVILFDLTDWNMDALWQYQGLKENAKLASQRVSVVLLVSEETLSHLQLTLDFDDLILLPLNRRELDFRIKHLLRRKNISTEEEILEIDEIIVYLARYEVWVRGEKVELTFKEYELLKYLISHRGRAFNRENLLNVIWGQDYFGGTRTVDVHIRRLRAKLGDKDEAYIKTVRGVGYKISS